MSRNDSHDTGQREREGDGEKRGQMIRRDRQTDREAETERQRETERERGKKKRDNNKKITKATTTNFKLKKIVLNNKKNQTVILKYD